MVSTTKNTNPQIGQVFYDPCQETMQVWDGSAWAIVGDARSGAFPMQTANGLRQQFGLPLPSDLIELEIFVVGFDCKIAEGSELHEVLVGQIFSIFDNAMTNGLNLEKAPDMCGHVGSELSKALKRNVDVKKIETWKQPNLLDDKIRIGVAVRIDQLFINTFSETRVERTVADMLGSSLDSRDFNRSVKTVPPTVKIY